MAAKSNSLLRRYEKLKKYHAEIMLPKQNTGQCVHSLKAFKSYVKTFRQIVLVENGDSIFKYTQL